MKLRIYHFSVNIFFRTFQTWEAATAAKQLRCIWGLALAKPAPKYAIAAAAD